MISFVYIFFLLSLSAFSPSLRVVATHQIVIPVIAILNIIIEIIVEIINSLY